MALALSSCSHSYYASNVHNVPFFQGRNELSFSGFLASGLDAASAEVQGAYSITDHFGLTGDYMNASSGDIKNKDYSTENYFAFGAGYFEPVNDVVSYAVYGGIGKSAQHHEYSSGYDPYGSTASYEYEGFSDVNYLKYYLQPQIVFSHKYVQFAVSTRLNILQFNDIFNTAATQSGTLDFLEATNHFYLEPAFTLRAGGEVIKFQFQALLSANFRNIEYSEYRHDFSHLSVGVVFNIPAGRKKNKKIDFE
jgi:hypothetical protein